MKIHFFTTLLLSVVLLSFSSCSSSSSGSGAEKVLAQTSGGASASTPEKDLASLTNAFRAKKGKSSLPSDPLLNEYALRKAKELAENHAKSGNLSHKGFKQHSKRARAAGWKFTGENLAYTSSVGSGVGGVLFTMLNDGKGHTKNMLDSKWTAMGTAIVKVGSHYYAVQEFGGK